MTCINWCNVEWWALVCTAGADFIQPCSPSMEPRCYLKAGVRWCEAVEAVAPGDLPISTTSTHNQRHPGIMSPPPHHPINLISIWRPLLQLPAPRCHLNPPRPPPSHLITSTTNQRRRGGSERSQWDSPTRGPMASHGGGGGGSTDRNNHPGGS